ncbi:MAG: tRNA (guanosine(46)-N7)-methyltransferase TrmB, partial [Thermosynechococcaceae cyanobacterium]
INVSLPSLFTPDSIQGVTIQFPDPWFKKRHQKRRVVQPQFIQVLTQRIRPGGFLFIQSDVLEVAEQMRSVISANPTFTASPDSDPWLLHNPFPVQTEREIATLAAEKPVYRCWFTHRLNVGVS